ncbi:MAG: glucosaminidase domain-containing protein [Nitriliruptoraceae bacterium]|nr:glucosaminidase domain-containing protein [Nitriliruptoraceae bacterium]
MRSTLSTLPTLSRRTARRLGVLGLTAGGVIGVGSAVAVADPFEEPFGLPLLGADADAADDHTLDDVDLTQVHDVELIWHDAPTPGEIERTAVREPLVTADDERDDADAAAGSDDTVEVADDEVHDEGPAVYVGTDGEEITAERIEDFLGSRDATLADHAETIVAAGVRHDVDPRVVVGIAIAESNGGDRLPSGTYNAWGWSGSGPHGLAAWGSWEESIDTYTERLGALYDTDDVDVDFAQTYCPPNWQWWLDTVTWSMQQI